MKPLRLAAFLIAILLCSPAVLRAQAPSSELSISVTGDVSCPLSLSEADLAAMPRETADVTEEDGQETTYEGVPLQEILKKAGISFGHDMRGKALVGYILAEAHDGYQVLFSMGELDSGLGATRIIIADKRNGKPLFGYQGPARLVVPGDKEGARSVRMLEKIQVVRLRK